MFTLRSKKSMPVSTQKKDNPFASIQYELDKAIANFSDWFEPFNFPSKHFENLNLTPALDIIDEKNKFKIEAELPGMDEKNIEVSISDGILTIKGEKTVSEQNKDKNYMMREINYGNYTRSIILPESVDIKQATASFRKGMLWVEIHKKKESAEKSKTIEVRKA